MRKLTAAERKAHDQACDLLWGSDKRLSPSEIEIVYTNWLPYAEHSVEVSGTFFTPPDMAMAFSMHGPNRGSVVDLGAGVGVLLWGLMARQGYGTPIMGSFKELTAVEYTESYLKVGQRLLPEVNWVHGDVLDISLWERLGRFDHAVTNPPFGNVAGNSDQHKDLSWLAYQGKNEFMFIEIGLRVAGSVNAIMPRMSVPYEYHTNEMAGGPLRTFERRENTVWKGVLKALPGIEVCPSSQPTDEWVKQWRGTSVQTEIVSYNMEYTSYPLGLMTRTSQAQGTATAQLGLF